MFVRDRYHLTYCTNIHPGQDWNTTFQSLKEYVPVIKQAISKDQPFGIGLRLSNKASEELNINGHLEAFKTWLHTNDIYVFTMNGFPYGNFHKESVKDLVHEPDWTMDERLVYTKRLFDQLAFLLPSGLEGGISTSPISYKLWHRSDDEKSIVLKKGAEQMVEIAMYLRNLEEKTGSYMHLDIEPEPDGMLENTREVIDFYEQYLRPVGKAVLKNKWGINASEALAIINRYITVCYDICHFSLAYEEPAWTFKKLEAANVRIGKIQVSAALKILFQGKNPMEIWSSLKQFDEPTYLHQVTEKLGDKVRTFSDLPMVLDKRDQDFKELRAHFHVPIFLESFEALSSTQDHILKVIEYLKNQQVTSHLEIETYTWDVLPQDLKKDLSESIIREIQWLKEKL